MTSKFLAALLGLLFAGTLVAEKSPDFMPLPDSVVVTGGWFHVDDALVIVAPEELAGEAGFISERLREGLGLTARVAKSGRGVSLAIDGSMPSEGYFLEITPTGVTIRGGDSAGVFYGIQTFLQTLPAAVYGHDRTGPVRIAAPALRIRDQPTMPWRGVMLDSARHFQPKEFILKFLDAMAAQKLNRLHWHLTDNEAWRLEIKKYPKLTVFTKGSPEYYPEEIPTNPTARPTYRYGWPHGGGFYSQADVREIVGYAARRHIVIVPEIEIPGHAGAALTAYPEFSATRREPKARSGHSPDLFGVHPEAVFFLKDVLDETMDLFPGTWIHLGGDESFRNPENAWKRDAGVRDTIEALGLRANDPANPNATEEALHAWLMNTLSAHLATRGRRAVGWEEIVRGDNATRLDPKPVVMTWLGRAEVAKSANSGYDVVLADGFAFYLDSLQSSDAGEPKALYAGPFTSQNIQRYDIFRTDIAPGNRRHILGAQASLWTELMPRTDDVEYQAFPRLCALAELTWTAPEQRADTFGFLRRLSAHGDRLTAMGLNHRRTGPVSPVRWTPDVLEKRIPMEFPVPGEVVAKIAAGSPVTATFLYRCGVKGLAITSVELLSEGKVIAADAHPGFAGGSSRDTTYRLAPPPHLNPGPLTLRIIARGEGGDDSSGEVVIKAGR